MIFFQRKQQENRSSVVIKRQKENAYNKNLIKKKAVAKKLFNKSKYKKEAMLTSSSSDRQPFTGCKTIDVAIGYVGETKQNLREGINV